MVEIELSTIGEKTTESVRLLLDQFEARHHIRVRLNPLNYDQAWAQLVKCALYNHGPDVSQVGSTWISHLVIMNALRPFTAGELAELGGASVFLPVLWENNRMPGQPDVWAIPWAAGTRLIYYRRNWLQKAGVDETTAFTTHAQLEQTLARLQADGIVAPWVVPSLSTTDTLHFVASWIWGAGGDFVAADGTHLLFTQAAALKGLRDYFGLYPYLSSAVRELDGLGTFNFFLTEPGAAVTLNGPWMWVQLSQREASADNIGMALMPGVPFIGAEYLAVWKYTHHPEAAIKLIRFLTSPEVQKIHSQQVNLLPVRLDVLAEDSGGDPVYQVQRQALLTGRSFPSQPHWGLIEEKLVDVLGKVWEEILASPQPEIDSILRRRMQTLLRHLTPFLPQKG